MIAFLKRKDVNNIDHKISKKNNHENIVEREESAKGGLLPFLIPALARRIGDEGEEKSEEVMRLLPTITRFDKNFNELKREIHASFNRLERINFSKVR